MAIFSKRTEDDKTISITVKHQHAKLVSITLMFILLKFKNFLNIQIIISGLLIIILYEFIETVISTIEIRKAMKKDGILVKGSHYSNKNPLSYTITK